MIVKKVVVDKANRLFQLPPDILAYTRDKTRTSLIRKSEVLDLARFRWPVTIDQGDLPQESGLVRATRERIDELKEALIEWFRGHQNVTISSPSEILISSGISNLIFTTALALVNNGDIVFVPELGVPLYRSVVTASGGESVSYGISQHNEWLPDFERVGTRLGRIARLLFLNSPHNPTGAVLDERDFENLLWIAARENIIVVNDACYQSIGDRTAPSILSVAGGKKVAVEVYSFSYQFGLPPLPFGFMVGNREVIAAVSEATRFTSQVIPDFYVSLALDGIRRFPNEALKRVRRGLDLTSAEATKFLHILSLEKSGHDSVPYIWTKIEKRKPSLALASLLYRRSRILTAPGTGFGDIGEGYLRLSLTATPDDFRGAAERVGKKIRLFKLGESS